MRYICENDHIFEHTGKEITLAIDGDNSLQLEIPICPICVTRIYSEYVLDKKRITSVISVSLEEVDAKLQEGYEVENLYAKTATLVKKD